ncbi:MAG: hypothetical protein JNL22_05330 [Bacteroidales bacterium]|jgi:hypothetical protein|nr:hypothetical protein [Bacteroidales bacterium]
MRRSIPALVALLMLSLNSCKLEGDRYEKYTGTLGIVDISLPDTAFTGQEVPVYASTAAYNGCWSQLTLYLLRAVDADTLLAVTANGLYESYNGLCTEILVTDDTTFRFKPDRSGTYFFTSVSPELVTRVDTLVVVDSAAVNPIPVR